MNRLISLFTALLLCVLFSPVVFAEPAVSASSAVLMVADTGEVVYEKNAHFRRSMASTTKIMTALLTAEQGTPERVVTVTEQMAMVEGTSMGLLPGDKVSFHDLIYGMLLASGNDAANTAAISIDGSIEKFALRMNKKAKQIGMANTNFVTPSGLDDENHYSTAYDMALLGCYALKNAVFSKACSSGSAKLCYGNEPYIRYLSNHNRLLRMYDGAIGIKTGFTKKSGRCLVSAAQRGGVTLVCVTLNAPDDWNDHKRLLDYGFEQTKLNTLDITLPELIIAGGTEALAQLELANPLVFASLSATGRFENRIMLKHFEFAPVSKGETVGSVQVMLGGKIVASSDILVSADVIAKTVEDNTDKNIFERISDFFTQLFTKGRRLICQNNL